jgi:hypothetical protein
MILYTSSLLRYKTLLHSPLLFLIITTISLRKISVLSISRLLVVYLKFSNSLLAFIVLLHLYCIMLTVLLSLEVLLLVLPNRD